MYSIRTKERTDSFIVGGETTLKSLTFIKWKQWYAWSWKI